MSFESLDVMDPAIFVEYQVRITIIEYIFENFHSLSTEIKKNEFNKSKKG